MRHSGFATILFSKVLVAEIGTGGEAGIGLDPNPD